MSYSIQYINRTTEGTYGFNSLANGGSSAFEAIDNFSGVTLHGAMFMDVGIVLDAQAVARSADAYLLLETAYSGSILTLATIDLDAVTDGRVIVVYGIPAPPMAEFTLRLTNFSGQATSASGNSFSVVFYDVGAV